MPGRLSRTDQYFGGRIGRTLADSEAWFAELIDLSWSEAERQGVLRLDDRGVELFAAHFRDRSPHPVSRRDVHRRPMSPIPSAAAPDVGGRGFDLTARVMHGKGVGGVI